MSQIYWFFCQASIRRELPNETQIAALLVVLVASGNTEEHVIIPAKYFNMITLTLELTSPCQTGMIDFKAIPEAFRAESGSTTLAKGSVLNSHGRAFIFPRLTGTITAEEIDSSTCVLASACGPRRWHVRVELVNDHKYAIYRTCYGSRW